MRYAKRRDENEPGIVEALEAAGYDVLRTDEIDLIVGKNERNWLLEVKHPKRASESKIKPSQKRLRANWRGQYTIVTTPLEALKAVGAFHGTQST